MRKTLFFSVVAALLFGFSGCRNVDEHLATAAKAPKGGFTFTISSGGGRGPVTYTDPGDYSADRISGKQEDCIGNLEVVIFKTGTNAPIADYFVKIGVTPTISGITYTETSDNTRSFNLSDDIVATLTDGGGSTVDIYVIANLPAAINPADSAILLATTAVAYSDKTAGTFVMSGKQTGVDITSSSVGISLSRRAARFDVVNASTTAVGEISIEKAYNKTYIFADGNGASTAPAQNEEYTTAALGPGSGPNVLPGNKYIDLPKKVGSTDTEHVVPGVFYLNPTIKNDGTDMPKITITLDDIPIVIDWTATGKDGDQTIVSIDANKRYKIIVANDSHTLTLVSEDWDDPAGNEIPIKKPDPKQGTEDGLSEATAFTIKTEAAMIALSANSTTDFFGQIENLSTSINPGNYTNLWANIYYYRLGENITLTEPWRPICAEDGQEFGGHFDGKNYTISIDTFNAIYSYKVGLFGETKAGATISNLHVQGHVRYSTDTVGGIVGVAKSCVIRGCSFSGSVNGLLNAGGIAGILRDAKIINCYATCNIEAALFSGGGIVGDAQGTSTIEDCYHSGTVRGVSNAGGILGNSNSHISIPPNITISNCHHTAGTITSGNNTTGGIVGGIIGWAVNVVIRGCSATCDITCNYCLGGIAGLLGTASIIDCYHKGNVNAYGGTVYEGLAYSGGLTGSCSSSSTIRSSYHTGSVTAVENLDWKGGIVGSVSLNSNNVIENCYWSAPANAVGNGSANANITGTFQFGAGAWPTAEKWDESVWRLGSWNGGSGIAYPELIKKNP